MSDVRKFMLEPGIPVLKLHRVDAGGQQWLPETPAHWVFRVSHFPWRSMVVWGDATNRLVCAIWEPFSPVPFSEYRSTRQLPPDIEWRWVRRLDAGDPLPVPFGPTVAAYIARVEAGGDA